MADFSKQWCDENDSDMSYDFDIEEIFDRLPDNTYENWICEGYGFDAIGKINGVCCLSFPTEDMAHFRWIPLSELVK
jgi:hypothetical protein